MPTSSSKKAAPKGDTSRSKRDDVMSYTHMITEVARETGLKKSQVRRVLETTQRVAAIFLRDKPDNRVHFGRFGILHSKMTSERKVNNPRAPGEQLTSPAHMVVRFTLGSRANAFMNNGDVDWDSAGRASENGEEDEEGGEDEE